MIEFHYVMKLELSGMFYNVLYNVIGTFNHTRQNCEMFFNFGENPLSSQVKESTFYTSEDFSSD